MCLGGQEETQPGSVAQTDKRDIPDHTTSCSAHKNKEKKLEGGCLERWNLSSEVTMDGALLSWRWLSSCLPMNSSGGPCLVLFVCVAFALSINLSLSHDKPTSFLAPTLLPFTVLVFTPRSH